MRYPIEDETRDYRRALKNSQSSLERFVKHAKRTRFEEYGWYFAWVVMFVSILALGYLNTH